MKPMLIAAAAMTAMIALPVAAQNLGTERTDLQRHDLSIPGWEMVQLLVGFKPGLTAPRHSHPGEEIVYVVEGTIEYRIDGKPPVRLSAGQVLFIPKGAIHAATKVGNGHAAELATYIVEKGKPLVVIAP